MGLARIVGPAFLFCGPSPRDNAIPTAGEARRPAAPEAGFSYTIQNTLATLTKMASDRGVDLAFL